MAEMRQVAGTCDDLKTCPKVWDEGVTAVIQGDAVIDDATLSQIHLGPGEIAVRIPAHLIIEAAKHLKGQT